MAGPAENGFADGAGHRRVRRYTRLVRWMKIALPLTALALIAAIFLSARHKGDATDLFTAEELATLGAGLKLDNPRFAGVTSRGEAFSVQADWALPDSAMPRIVDLERPRGEIELADGRKLTASARTGRMLRKEKLLILAGAVVLDSSDGYHVETERLEFDLGGQSAVAPGPVRGSGPRGTIEAGSMRAMAASTEVAETGAGTDAGPAAVKSGTIWFENRVRLVFIPGVNVN